MTVFGAPLDSKSRTVPPVLKTLVEYFEIHDAYKHEGIFRLSGKFEDVKELKDAFNRGETPILSNYDPYVIAVVLKQYFTELPVPLLTFDLYDCFLAAASVPHVEAINQSIRSVLKLLPVANLIVIDTLSRFLKKVSDFSDINKMGASNLAIVFAPSLLRPIKETIDSAMKDSKYTVRLMELFIAQTDQFFDPAHFSDLYEIKRQSGLFTPVSITPLPKNIPNNNGNNLSNNNGNSTPKSTAAPITKPLLGPRPVHPKLLLQSPNNNNNNNNSPAPLQSRSSGGAASESVTGSGSGGTPPRSPSSSPNPFRKNANQNQNQNQKQNQNTNQLSATSPHQMIKEINLVNFNHSNLVNNPLSDRNTSSSESNDRRSSRGRGIGRGVGSIHPGQSPANNHQNNHQNNNNNSHSNNNNNDNHINNVNNNNNNNNNKNHHVASETSNELQSFSLHLLRTVERFSLYSPDVDRFISIDKNDSKLKANFEYNENNWNISLEVFKPVWKTSFLAIKNKNSLWCVENGEVFIRDKEKILAGDSKMIPDNCLFSCEVDERDHIALKCKSSPSYISLINNGDIHYLVTSSQPRYFKLNLKVAIRANNDYFVTIRPDLNKVFVNSMLKSFCELLCVQIEHANSLCSISCYGYKKYRTYFRTIDDGSISPTSESISDREIFHLKVLGNFGNCVKVAIRSCDNLYLRRLQDTLIFDSNDASTFFELAPFSIKTPSLKSKRLSTSYEC